MNKGKQLPVIWDLPTRLFHWCLVLMVGILLASASKGKFELHALAGEGVLALLVFRLVWGLVGSQTARFGDFLGEANPVSVPIRSRNFQRSRK
ncbi:MAG TPA: hypothetical protein PKD55_24765 [Bellilinea sp.]|nr:hypothetical protein [Bellilinea sp.]